MLKRVISGVSYVIIIVGFFLLKVYVSYLTFDVLLCFFCVMGTFEIARALKKFIVPCGFWISIIGSMVFSLSFVLSEYFLQLKFALIITSLLLISCLLTVLIIKCITYASWKAYGITLLPLVYPFLGIFAIMIINTLEGMGGLIGLILVFSVPAFSDSLAYFVGITANKIKKGQTKKLCPSISPNKTWVGAVGAAIGGAIAGILVYVVFKHDMNIAVPLLMLCLVGFIAGIINVFGDLFESYIKRKVNIKDSGKIMPGHGGIMDRIDGMVFTAVYLLGVVFIIWD